MGKLERSRSILRHSPTVSEQLRETSFAIVGSSRIEGNDRFLVPVAIKAKGIVKLHQKQE
jgi:hypothetical protein